MSKVLITGSADGLGREAAQQLVRGGHEVVLHARDEARAAQALAGVPGATAALPGDLSSIASTRALADRINAAGAFDAIIHNAGIGYREPTRRETEDGLEHVFQTNVLAPYLLTALVNRPARLIYLSSGLHRSGDPGLADLQWEHRRWDGYQAYSDSKLFDAVLAAAVARRWPNVVSSSVDPGWVRTKMGGPGGARRDRPRGRDASLARHQWRPTRDAKRPPLLPPTATRNAPGRRRPRRPGRPARRLL